MQYQFRSKKPIQLSHIVSSKRFSRLATLFKIHQKWAESVGPKISDRTQPVALFGRTLVVHVANSMWLNHLVFFTSKIKRQLKQNGIVVESIQFKIGALYRSSKDKDACQQHDTSHSEPNLFHESTEKIPFHLDDTDLHNQLSRLYIKFHGPYPADKANAI